MAQLVHGGGPGDAMVVDAAEAMSVATAGDLVLLRLHQLALAAIRVKQAHDAILSSPRGRPLEDAVALEHLHAQTELAEAISVLARCPATL